ncbi:MAG: RNA 2'-phosphotransferase [Deltaproteobacteria bacterium]|nr:RNA 2'-phosphotransferase [Deltaproteobacteria bacterium]
MPKKAQIKVENLRRLLLYILGRQPDEFGLLPDAEGFVALKELLKAIHEEEGWGHVRAGHIQEILMGEDRSLFEWDEGRIRCRERNWELDLGTPCPSPPKILFFAIRRKAHPHVLEKGLRAGAGGHLALSPQREMALRIGGRRDPRPVLLEIRTSAALGERVSFYAFGDLFLAREIPPGCITGPPLPREPVRPPRAPERERQPPVPPELLSGTFVLDPKRDPDPSRRHRGKKEKGWKEEAKKFRRRRGR